MTAMAQRIVTKRLSRQELSTLFRDGEPPVILMSGLHNDQHAFVVISMVERVYGMTGALAVGDEVFRGKEIIELYDRLTIKGSVPFWQIDALLPQVMVPVFDAYVNLRTDVPDGKFKAFPIDIGPDDSGYKAVMKNIRVLSRPVIGDNCANHTLEYMIPEMSRTIVAAIEAAAVRNPIMARNINDILIPTGLPVFVSVGVGNASYLEEHINSDRVISVVNPESMAYRSLELRAEEAASKGKQTKADRFAVAQFKLYNFALVHRSLRYRGEVEKASTMSELEGIRRDMVNGGLIGRPPPAVTFAK